METEFDYIIVGGGAAGCVLAARLSEDPDVRVALIEAGGKDKSFLLRVPIGFAKLYYNKKYNWMYSSEPQPALGGRRIYCPRGKVMGGSGAINAMIFVRGDARDYDGWAAEGNTGWAYKDVLPFFRKLEYHASGENQYHGADGPIGITSLRDDAHEICKSFIAGSKELGVPENPDFNGAQIDGAGYYDVNIRHGRRSSANFEYLAPASARSNLVILHDTVVRQVLIDDTRSAYGVEIMHAGSITRLHGRREVILSAGAVATPQLLQLSGVGDATLLRTHGIPFVRHLPAVGKYLQDHLCASYYYRATQKTLNDDFRNPIGLARFGLQYVLRRKGPFAMSVNQSGGFFRAPAETDAPNIQLYFNPLSYRVSGDAKAKLTPEPYSGFLVCFNACHPTSRGTVQIGSRDINDPARIDPNYLATEHDITEVLAASRLVRRLMQTPSLRAATAAEVSPGPDVNDDAAFLDYFRANSGSIYHLCGSARMGQDPELSAVDERLRVHGIKNLRIVDASIFPSITAGNIQAPVLMIAEKAASMIKGDYR